MLRPEALTRAPVIIDAAAQTHAIGKPPRPHRRCLLANSKGAGQQHSGRMVHRTAGDAAGRLEGRRMIVI